MDRTWAVVVARTGLTAKTRLAPALPRPEDRARLARAMLSDVLAACGGAGLAGTLVVTDTGAGWSTAWNWGARPMLDPSAGLNAAVSAGLAAAIGLGARTALVLPGDVPLVRPADLRDVLAAAGGGLRTLVVAADHTGHGTNALVVRPPDLVRPAFGSGSAAAHLAQVAGAVRYESVALELDIDTPAELQRLLELNTGRAPATRRFLGLLASPPDMPRSSG